jgi:type IV secretory pathway VirB10-like protein
MPRPVSRAELARLFGTTRANVTQRCRGAWAAACNGDRVDLDHESIQAAARKKGIDIGAPARAPTPSTKKPPPAPPAPTKVAKPAPAAPVEPTKRRRRAPEPKPEARPAARRQRRKSPVHRSRSGPADPAFGNGRGLKDWLSGAARHRDDPDQGAGATDRTRQTRLARVRRAAHYRADRGDASAPHHGHGSQPGSRFVRARPFRHFA